MLDANTNEIEDLHEDSCVDGIDMDDYLEPDHDDTVLCCPDCERPNQFGELCSECIRERDREYEAQRSVPWDESACMGNRD